MRVFCARTSAARGSTSRVRCAALGVASIPIGFLGGATGRAIRDGLAAQGYDARFVEVPGETRQNLTLLDEATGVYTKINEPGPTVGSEHLAALYALVDELAAPGDLWALCGSLPPGAPADLYADLVTAVQARGAAAILDTSETALAPGAGGAAGRHQAQQRGSGPGFGSNGIQRRGARGRGAPPVRSPGPGDASRAHRLPDAAARAGWCWPRVANW